MDRLGCMLVGANITNMNIGISKWSDNKGWEKRLMLEAKDSKGTLLLALRGDHYTAVSRPKTGYTSTMLSNWDKVRQERNLNEWKLAQGLETEKDWNGKGGSPTDTPSMLGWKTVNSWQHNDGHT